MTAITSQVDLFDLALLALHLVELLELLGGAVRAAKSEGRMQGDNRFGSKGRIINRSPAF
jgi:hypothetical protein